MHILKSIIWLKKVVTLGVTLCKFKIGKYWKHWFLQKSSRRLSSFFTSKNKRPLIFKRSLFLQSKIITTIWNLNRFKFHDNFFNIFFDKFPVFTFKTNRIEFIICYTKISKIFNNQIAVVGVNRQHKVDWFSSKLRECFQNL